MDSAKLYDGSPSQAVNLPTIIAAILCAIGMIEVGRTFDVGSAVVLSTLLTLALAAIGRVVVVASTSIVIDQDRIVFKQGVFRRRTSSLELFRVQDVTLEQSFWERLFDLGTVIIDSSDLVNPHWEFEGMPHAQELRDLLNKAALEVRSRKGVRELNVGRV